MQIEIASRQCRDDLGRLRHFHYFLVVDLVETSQFSLEHYGVRIAEEDGDSACLPGLTTSASGIDELLTLLVDHLVGPTGLPDVVEDWCTRRAVPT